MQLSYMDLAQSYATPENEFVWFDWGVNFAAMVYPQAQDEPFIVLIGQEPGAYAFGNMLSAVEYIGQEIAEAKS